LQLLLSSIDLHFQRVANLGVTVAVHIAVNGLLIPKFGALGAAGATLLSGVLLIVLYAWSASRRRRFQFMRWLVVPSGMAILIVMATLLSDGNAYIQAGVAFLAFTVGLYLVGFVHRDEIRFVFQSVLANGRQSGE
jgi:O-antigen/teichoic acid export membrane protein